MEATVKPIETTTTNVEEKKEAAEALRELASFELSLVGGGYGAAIFA